MPCYHIPLPILSLEEQITFFFNFCNRDIEKYEIDIEEECDKDKLSLNDLIEKSKRIKLCYGQPKILRKLCEICSTINLKQIKLSEFLPEYILNNIKNKNEINKFYEEFNKTHSFVRNKTLINKSKGMKTVTRIIHNPELTGSIGSCKSGIENNYLRSTLNHEFSSFKGNKNINRLNSVVSKKADSLCEEVNDSKMLNGISQPFQKKSTKNYIHLEKDFETLSGKNVLI